MAPEPPSQLDGWDETRETVEGFRNASQSFYPGRYPTDNSYFPRYEMPPPNSAGEISSVLSGVEAVGLFREAVESARLGIQQSLAGSDKDKVGEAIRAKLTVDLSHRSIEDMPEEIVDIVKRDVEGLSLADNQIWHIPYRFAECSPIKYLNLRDNLFKEFPKAIYRLPQLEILDLSRNKLGRIPDDIKNMKALRVLSLTHNGIRDLPSCIGSLDGLDILKISENPLNLNLMRVMDGTDGSSSPLSTTHTDNEKERSMTKRIKKYLKAVGVTKEYGEESSSDGPLETPRPLKRNLSLRFPVKPSNNGNETVIDGKPAGFQRPPIPTRSHFRIASGQGEHLQAAALRRPGAAVQAGNERIRSNSESILQASQNMTNRSKRMGIVPKKNPDPGAPDEARTNRNSLHYRGQSHGSALRDKHSNAASNGGSFAGSQYEQDRQKGTFIHRLSSLPEQKNETQSLDNIIEGARGVLYSLHQVHQHISSLIDVLDEGQSERSSLVMVYHNATTQLLLLDGALQDFDKVPLDHGEEREKSNSNVRYACSTCIVAYRQIGNLLLRDSAQLIADVDQKYIRTLVLLLYGSLVEARNACLTLGVRFENRKIHAVNQRIPTIHEEVEKRRDRSLTPTREYPNPERRWRNGNAIQQSGNLNVFNPLANAQSSLPPHINGRSRANSRTSANGSATSSIANTPHSGESFPIPGIPMVRSRSNSVMSVPHSTAVRQATADEPEKEYLFEKIFVRLSSSVEQGLASIPTAQAHFRKCLLEAQNNNPGSKICNLWGELIWRSGFCLELSEALKNRLSAIKLHEPNNQRQSSDFWRMCVRYVNAVVDLLNYVRLAGRDELIHVDLIRTLRPIHLSARDALKDIKASPWMRLIRDNPVEPPRYSSLSNVSNHTYRHHRAAGSSGSGSITSPQSSIPPATPLSAALGVAAQATIPSTPVGLGGGLDRSFQGDVFQRADSLLTLQQTMVYRR